MIGERKAGGEILEGGKFGSYRVCGCYEERSYLENKPLQKSDCDRSNTVNMFLSQLPELGGNEGGKKKKDLLA